MKKMVKIIAFVFCVLAFLLILSTKANANSINKITMDIYLDESGNATITEIWNANLTQGTEGYRTYKHLENSSISNFIVIDDSGRTYETLSKWNSSDSFNGKAYKCGINNVLDGVELCWGISNYGTRTYVLKYEISNFVTQYVDAQGIYFNFLNLDQQVNNAKITIHSDISFSTNNAKIWGFGYNGTINFNNGSIVLNSEGSISTSQYMVALIKFEDNIFTTTNMSKSYFNNVYDEATSKENYSENTMKSIIIRITLEFLAVILVIFILVITILVILKEKKAEKKRRERLNSVKYGEYGKNLLNMEDIEYFRDIPCNGDLSYAYWLCAKYSITSERLLRKNILGAILLKWIKDGYITILETDKRFIWY